MLYGLKTLNFHCYTFLFIFRYSFNSELMDIHTAYIIILFADLAYFHLQTFTIYSSIFEDESLQDDMYILLFD